MPTWCRCWRDAAGGDAADPRRVRQRHRRAAADCDSSRSPPATAFGALSRLELTAAAACVTYVERTQIGKRPPLSPPSRESAGATMAIDPATRANLELTRTLVGRAARLAARCHRPHRHRRRLAAAGATPGGAAHRSGRDRAAARCGRRASSPTSPRAPKRARALRAAPDLARALARLSVGRGGPRDLAAIRDGIARRRRRAGASARLARQVRRQEIADRDGRRCRRPDAHAGRRIVARAGRRTAAASSATAASCATGYDAALDETRALRDDSRRVVAAMQARYADDTGIKGLKIRHNNVLGYFVEVTAQHGDKLMARAAQRHLHPSPDAGRPGALHHHRTRRDRSQDRQRRRARARAGAGDLRAARRAMRDRGQRDDQRLRRRAFAPRRRAARWRNSPPSATMCGPRSTTALLRHRGRPASGGRAGAEARRQAVHRQ